MISKHASVPLVVAAIGWVVTFGCFALGQALIHSFGRVPNVRLAISLLVIMTLTTPIVSFAVIATHYKPSAASVLHIICLYLALILVCANLDFDLVLHFGREGAVPLRGIEPVWSHDEAGQTEIVWRAFGKAVLACLHFSIETLSTFNDGEIVPATWYAKLAVDVQILMGLGITVLTVGRHFSRCPGTEVASLGDPRKGKDAADLPEPKRKQPRSNRVIGRLFDLSFRVCKAQRR